MGITFKENCPDIRNTKVVEVIRALKEYDTQITVFDPWANPDEVKQEYGLEIKNRLPEKQFDAVVIAVNHKAFEEIDYSHCLKNNSILYSLK